MNMKCSGYNYIILSALGGPELVSMYESYGFRKFIYDEDFECYDMFGFIDEIIQRTK